MTVVVDHVRHSMRRPGGTHLRQAGVLLAREVDYDLGPYNHVVTSTLPRAFETAIAMGFAVDRQEELLTNLLGVDRFVQWDAGFAAFADVASNPVVEAAAVEHAHLMLSIAESVGDGGRVLVVSHGGMIELGVVGLVSREVAASLGGVCGYCEGVRLRFEQGICTGVEALRLPPGLLDRCERDERARTLLS